MMTKQAELKQQAYASSLKSRSLSVLIYLIDRSNKDMTCYPAIPTIAEQLHISVSTVKRALKELTDAGYIQKEVRFRERTRGQSSNLYILLYVEQMPISNKENTPVNTDRDKIDMLSASDKGQMAGYITFGTLAKADAYSETSTYEKASKSEESHFCGNYAIPILDSSVHSPYTDSYKWTGVGVILHPP